jgi:hypothetical protein
LGVAADAAGNAYVADLASGLIGYPVGVAISNSSMYITTYDGVAVVHDFP